MDRKQWLIEGAEEDIIEKIKKSEARVHMLHWKHLSKSICPQTQEDRDNMSRIPYASAIGLIRYSMLCTRLDVSFSFKYCQ